MAISFSLNDYQNALARQQYGPPVLLCPYYDTDPVLYRELGKTDLRRKDLNKAFEEIRKRTGQVYFRKIYPLQGRTLDYSTRAFPAYRFILPEVLTEDWLAIVDWGKFQRDHALHQPLCGYVVLKLLDGDGVNGPLYLPGGTTLLDACVDRILCWDGTAFIRDFLLDCGMDKNDPILDADSEIARMVWRTFFRETAYLAAVFHDIGYPWQYAGRVHGNLNGMNTPAVKQNQSATQVVEQFGHRLLFDALCGYQKQDAARPSNWDKRITKIIESALSNSHGLVGSLGFLHLNDCVRRYPANAQNPMRLLCIEWVATAIMMHDMADTYWGDGKPGVNTPENPFLRLDFNKDPLSALVTLVDQIEDFERPTVSFASGSPDDHVTLTYKTACKATELDIGTTGSLTMDYRMSTDANYFSKRNFLPKGMNTYFDPQHGYINMQSLGIKHVQLTASR